MKTRKWGTGCTRFVAAFTAGLVSLSMLGFAAPALAVPLDPDSQSPATAAVVTEDDPEDAAGALSISPEELLAESEEMTDSSPMSTEAQSETSGTDQVDEELATEVQVEDSQSTELTEVEQSTETGEEEQSGEEPTERLPTEEVVNSKANRLATPQTTAAPTLLAATFAGGNFCSSANAPATYSLTTSTTTARQMVTFPTSGTDSATVGTFTTLANANSLNGLAITPDGSVAYAVERSGTNYRVMKLAADQSSATQVVFVSVTTNGANAMVGAVNPAGTIYYFGHFARAGTGTNSELRLHLFAYNIATNTWIGQVGYVALLSTTAAAVSAADGDITFDTNGNLLILWGSSASGVDSRLYRLPAASVPTTASTSATAAATSVSTITTTASSAWNGLTFDDAGSLWMQRLSGTSVVRQQINPSNGALIGSGVTIGGIAGNDLAGCFQTVPKVTAANWPLNSPTNSGTTGGGAIPTVTSTWTPTGTQDDGVTRTFTVTYSTTTAITNARLWHQYMVAHDHQTTYSVTCARTGTATCPTAGTNGMPPTSGLVLNGEADAYYNTFWAIVNLPANSSLTFTITVTSTLADTDDACAADPTVMVDGWARFSQTGFVVPTNVQASASSAGRIRATQCPNGVVTMTNTVTSPGPAANPGRVLSGDARVFTVTWENTGGSTVALPIWYSYLVPHQGNSTEASWTCTSTGGGGASCPTSFPLRGNRFILL